MYFKRFVITIALVTTTALTSQLLPKASVLDGNWKTSETGGDTNITRVRGRKPLEIFRPSVILDTF